MDYQLTCSKIFDISGKKLFMYNNHTITWNMFSNQMILINRLVHCKCNIIQPFLMSNIPSFSIIEVERIKLPFHWYD